MSDSMIGNDVPTNWRVRWLAVASVVSAGLAEVLFWLHVSLADDPFFFFESKWWPWMHLAFAGASAFSLTITAATPWFWADRHPAVHSGLAKWHLSGGWTPDRALPFPVRPPWWSVAAWLMLVAAQCHVGVQTESLPWSLIMAFTGLYAASLRIRLDVKNDYQFYRDVAPPRVWGPPFVFFAGVLMRVIAKADGDEPLAAVWLVAGILAAIAWVVWGVRGSVGRWHAEAVPSVALSESEAERATRLTATRRSSGWPWGDLGPSPTDFDVPFRTRLTFVVLASLVMAGLSAGCLALEDLTTGRSVAGPGLGAWLVPWAETSRSRPDLAVWALLPITAFGVRLLWFLAAWPFRSLKLSAAWSNVWGVPLCLMGLAVATRDVSVETPLGFVAATFVLALISLGVAAFVGPSVWAWRLTGRGDVCRTVPAQRPRTGA